MRPSREYYPHGEEIPEIIDIGAKDEFGTLEAVCINGSCDPVEMAKACDMSFDAYKKAMESARDQLPQDVVACGDLIQELRSRSVHLLYPHSGGASEHDPIQHSPEMFCRDWIGVVDDMAIFSHLQDVRMEVRNDFQPVFERVHEQQRVEINEVLPWGNVLLHDDHLLIGTFDAGTMLKNAGKLTTEIESQLWRLIDSMNRGQGRLEHALRQSSNSRKIVEVELSHQTDLDLAITPLPKKRAGDKSVVLVSQSVTQKGMEALTNVFDCVLRCGESVRQKAYNVLWLNPETAVVSAESSDIPKIISQLGFEVIPLSVSGILAKTNYDSDGDVAGGWRCAVGPLRRANDYDY